MWQDLKYQKKCDMKNKKIETINIIKLCLTSNTSKLEMINSGLKKKRVKCAMKEIKYHAKKKFRFENKLKSTNLKYLCTYIKFYDLKLVEDDRKRLIYPLQKIESFHETPKNGKIWWRESECQGLQWSYHDKIWRGPKLKRI